MIMNRHQRRRAAAKSRKAKFLVQHSTGGAAACPLPYDIKRDIAKTVRRIEWCVTGVPEGGLCLWRALTGLLTLKLLGIDCQLALGGLVYRAGPDEWRDVVAFCGEGGIGRIGPVGLMGHYFLISGNEIVDFSAGDWITNTQTVPELILAGTDPLEPVQWTAPPPEFFWDARANFTPGPSAYTPELGCAFYTGFAGDPPDFQEIADEFRKQCMKIVMPHIKDLLERFALKERLFALNSKSQEDSMSLEMLQRNI